MRKRFSYSGWSYVTTPPFPFDSLSIDVIENNLNGESECEFLSTAKMWYIPRIYVCNKVDSYGNISFLYSNKPKEGYHLHPAFMYKGKAVKAIRVFANKATMTEIANKTPPSWLRLNEMTDIMAALKFSGTKPAITSTTKPFTLAQANAWMDAFNSAIGSRGGWHIMGYYEVSLLQRLLLAQLCYRPDYTLCNYNSYITSEFINVSGGIPVCYWTSPVVQAKDIKLQKVNNVWTLFVPDNKGYGNLINTGLKWNTDLVPRTEVFTNCANQWHLEKGDDYDLGDLFIPKPTGITVETSNISSSGTARTVNGKTRYPIGQHRSMFVTTAITNGDSIYHSDTYRSTSDIGFETFFHPIYFTNVLLNTTATFEGWGVAQRLFN